MYNRKSIEQGNGLLILGRRHKSNVFDKSKDGPYPYQNSRSNPPGIQEGSKRKGHGFEKILAQYAWTLFFQNPGVIYVFNTSLLFFKVSQKKSIRIINTLTLRSMIHFSESAWKKIHLDYLYLKLFSTWNFWT